MDGVYNFQWQMVQDGEEWFGSKSEIKQLIIGDPGSYLDVCDNITTWKSSAGLSLNTIEKQQGISCLEFTGSGTDEFKKVFSTPYDAHGTESGTVLEFWYYVSDLSQFQSTNQVEIGSLGGPDANEYSWKLENLSAGWNYIELNTNQANKIGNPDLSAINWFRLYRKKNGSVTTRIDGIKLIGENSLAIDDIVTREENFKCYPNPVDTNINIDFELSTSSIVSISLMNISGQIVSQSINRPGIKSGKSQS